ncbi:MULTISPECIES: hypothetical protein [unclassified Chryseobacterium]|uniref:hypothetical protein n=1 Tax=unclassified Chryseobacterium TaxID=2593645 RepID=UPI00095641B8|nr:MULTISPECIES: hypothetical protein [unclassified Chryseobacterium]SIR48215.1 hypothetical protein SAMN05880573_12415 [Chryseobacterium sp. RU33C]
MKTFKELIISTDDSSTLKNILEEIISKLPADWKFRQDLVRDYASNISKPENEIGCFESPVINGNKALVWFVLWQNELKIVNIVPIVLGSLTHDEYNDILDRFNNECIADLLDGKNVIVKKTGGIYDLKEIVGDSAYDALINWEKNCNHATGNINSFDFDRWASFVSLSFNDKSKLTPDLLERWLMEEKGWNDNDLVTKIVLDYEYALSILEFYVKNH